MTTAPAILPLLRAGTVGDHADACRSAALGFMAGARSWSKRQVAEWLECHYAPLTIPRVRVATPANVRPLRTRRVDEGALQNVVESAHAHVATELRILVETRTILLFGRAMVRSPLITRCIDENGESGWAPVAVARASLASRVMSLFAADFLARPWEYESSLRVCSDCDGVRLVDVACCQRVSGARPTVLVEKVA